MKIRCFALFDEGEDSAIITINNQDVVFTRETVQQDFDCAAVSIKSLNSDETGEKVLTDTQVSDTVTTPAE